MQHPPPTPTSATPAVLAPTPKRSASGRKLVQATARTRQRYTPPAAKPQSSVGARTPAATPSYAARATSVRVVPRWHGSHWATGRNAPIVRRKLAPQPALPLATVRSRGMYGY